MLKITTAAHAAAIIERFLQAKKIESSVVAIKDFGASLEPVQWPQDARFALTWTRNPRTGWVIDVLSYELHSERSKATPLISCTFNSSKMELLLIMSELHDITTMCEDVGVEQTLKHLHNLVQATNAITTAAKSF